MSAFISVSMPALSAFTEESVNVFKSIQMLSQKNKTFCNEISKFMKVASNEQKNNLLTFLFVNSNYVADNADALKNELKNYESKKVVELKQICKSLGLKSVGNNSKAELIERIQIEKIDYESLDSNYIESFQEWSKPFLSICSHSGNEITKLDNIKKTKNDKSVLDFLTRITKESNLYFTEYALVKDFGDQNTLDRFSDKTLEPKKAILAWILLSNNIDNLKPCKRLKLSHDDDEYIVDEFKESAVNSVSEYSERLSSEGSECLSSEGSECLSSECGDSDSEGSERLSSEYSERLSSEHSECRSSEYSERLSSEGSDSDSEHSECRSSGSNDNISEYSNDSEQSDSEVLII